ncbi:MAG: hypothetical protein F6K39_38665 [Okeania sp. SIO3B3]|nr:hypothetical protein [Okeania sp. SIO3B3]
MFASYSAFQINKPHRHQQNPVGTLHATSLLWSTEMKTAVILSYFSTRTYAEPLHLVGANGRSPLQMVYNFLFCISPVYKKLYSIILA